MTDTMYCCVCRGNIADFYHAIHVHAMAYSLLLAYRHFSSLLSSVFLLSQNWFKKDLTIESLSRVRERGGHKKTRQPPTWLLLNEQRDLSVFGALDEGGNARHLVNDRLKIREFHVEEFHGHAARIDFDLPDLFGTHEVLHPGGDLLHHHLLHHDRAILFEILTYLPVGLVVAFAERFQSPGGQEEFHFQAHGGPAGGEDGRSHQFIDGSRKDDNRHAIFHYLAPLFAFDPTI